MKLESLSRFFLGLVLLISCAIYSLRSVSAQTTSSSVLVFPTVLLTNCAIPAEVTWTASGYIALCNTTTGLAYAVSPSTTFTPVGGGGVSVTGAAPIVVTGGVVSCPSCATSPSGTGGPIKISTTVTAVSTAQ
jgi:hypothetical protein